MSMSLREQMVNCAHAAPPIHVRARRRGNAAQPAEHLRGETERREPLSQSDAGPLVLAFLSAITFAAARWESTWHPAGLLFATAIALSVPMAIGWAWRTRSRWRQSLERASGALLIGWTLLPAALEIPRRLLGAGDPPELVALAIMQHAALMLAAYGHRPSAARLSTLLSSFGILFALTMSGAWYVFAIAGLFGAAGLWWLMVCYWQFVAATQVAAMHEATRVERIVTVRWGILGGVMIVLMFASAVMSLNGSVTTLPGFLPSSGGDRWHDPFALSGVGDGDALVAAERKAESFGPVESELFLESHLPSLYDMFNDMYGEPLDQTRKYERSIGLASSEMPETERELAKTDASGREFSAVRRMGKRRPGEFRDRLGAAMLSLKGETPLHLRLETYSRFDGRVWQTSQAPLRLPNIRLVHQRQRPWIWVQDAAAASLLRAPRRHTLKVINLRTQRVPAPPQLAGLHIDRLDQVDFFAWSPDGALMMDDRDHLPQFTVLHLQSHVAGLQSLRNQDFTAADAQEAERWAPFLELPEAHGTWRHLAAEWTQDAPRGWRQVEAIVERLQTNYVCDRKAVVPGECKDVVGHFLAAGRGPDYLFATTAAMLLRCQGYPTRLAAGFYAPRDGYDRRSGQTQVFGDDAHVWVEVCVRDGVWVPIEPTPGYEPPREALTWSERLANAAYSAYRWCWSRAWSLLAIGLAVAGLILSRAVWISWLADGVYYAGWILFPQRRLPATLALLEWRMRRAGRRRPPGMPLTPWYRELQRHMPGATAANLNVLLSAAERAMYAPHPAPVGGEVLAACSAIAGRVTIRAIHAAFQRRVRAGVPQ